MYLVRLGIFCWSICLIFLAACKSGADAGKNTLTLVFTNNEEGIILDDSDKHTPEHIFKRNELPDILFDEKVEKGKELKVIVVKCRPFTERAVEEVISLLKEEGITRYKIKDANKEDAELYTRFINEMKFPAPLDLIMPKDVEAEETPQWPESKSLTSIIFNDSIYCYKGSDLKKGAFYSLSKKTYRVYLKQTEKKIGDSLFVFIKPSFNSAYSNIVDLLDEMTLNNIERYAMAKLNSEETSFLQIKNHPGIK